MDGSVCQKKIVLFIDILGFKDLIKNRKEFVILDALNISDRLKSSYPFCNDSAGSKMKMSAFSDCIVISMDISHAHDLVVLASYAVYLTWKFIAKGVLIRGGLTIGDLYHDSNGIVFGGGLIDAYEVESNLAIYPRIVVSDSFLEELNASKSKLDKGSLRLIDSLILPDFDGTNFIHFLVCINVPPECKPIKEKDENGAISYEEGEVSKHCFSLVENILVTASIQPPRVRAKYDWLRNYLERYKYQPGL